MARARGRVPVGRVPRANGARPVPADGAARPSPSRRVATGSVRAALRDLAARPEPLRRERSPVAGEVRERGVVRVAPRLVAQTGFREWTRDGRLRHPRFLGLRDDRAAREVVRE